MYQILQKFDIHWHDGGPSKAMMYHLRRVSDLLCNWKSCLLCYMKDVLHCSIFFKWNKLVRIRVRVQLLLSKLLKYKDGIFLNKDVRPWHWGGFVSRQMGRLLLCQTLMIWYSVYAIFCENIFSLTFVARHFRSIDNHLGNLHDICIWFVVITSQKKTIS